MAITCNGKFVYITDNFFFLRLYHFVFKVNLKQSVFQNSVSYLKVSLSVEVPETFPGP